MYDAIVVGARCAGAPLAMLLARKGYRVLLLDRSRFPSDMRMSTHLIHQPGVARLKRWGLLQSLVSSECPPVERYRYDVGEFALTGCPPPFEDTATAYAPRRTILDKILVDAAVAAGAELREEFAVDALVTGDGRVTGVHGSTDKGRTTITEGARIVIGADGMNSTVARWVRAKEYRRAPRRQTTYFSYWSDVELDGLEFYARNYQAAYAWRTNGGLTLVGVNWALEQFPKLPGELEQSFFQFLDRETPGLAGRLRAGRRAERWTGGSIPGFFRQPYGPGWALVGDAGYKMDPCTAAGITNAFRDAELVAFAIDEGLSGVRPLELALADYEQKRNEAALPIYDFACQTALFEPPTREIMKLLCVLRNNQAETNRFFGLLAQTTSITDYFDPRNLSRLVEGA